MNTHIKQITDIEFLTQFENQTLDTIYFNHVGHLRLAWLYLNRYDVETAVQRTCCGIQAYAQSLGATKKFNLTITATMVQIMAKRMNKSQWVTLLKASGMDENAMRQWHIAFERELPEAHTDFLESLGIEAEEIAMIKAFS